MKRFHRSGLVAVMALSAVIAHAQVNLAPGGSVVPPLVGLTGVTNVDFRSDAVIGLDALGNTTYTGILNSYVWRDNTTNNMIFGWQFRNDGLPGGGVADRVIRITATNFAGWTTAVAQDPAGALVAPGVLADLATRSANGRIIGWEFNNGIHAGQSSMGLFVVTDAPDYTRGQVSLIDGGTTSVLSFAPVPEPATMLVLGAGLAALAARRRRKG